MGWTDRLLRLVLTAAHKALRVKWLVRRPRTFGAHALALTPEGKVILVRLRYAPGWRLPGGGHGAREDSAEAVLRELREEIGMVSHGRVRLACELEQDVDHKQDLASLFVVEEVRYAPRKWSWEVERITEAPLDQLPRGMAPIARDWIAAVRGAL
ncbi:MAG TPA: NUDIX domain-containing protein [Sphingomicrobium sp.]|nr:NUDIX domain-containing protein [Sphingomicrobium sp.]